MSPTAMIVLALAAVLLSLLAIARRQTLVMALPFLVTLNGIRVDLIGPSFRLDQLVGCVLVVPLAASILIGARRIRWDAPMAWLAGILAANVLATVLHAPALSYSLMQCANLASVWIIYVLLVNFLDSREDLDAFFHRALWAAVLASGIGIGAYVLALSGFPVGGAEVSASAATRLTMAYGAYGTMIEPNLFGSFCAAHLVLACALLVGVAQPTPTLLRLTRWVAVFTAAGLVLSFTRAAWIGLIAGLVLLAILGRRTVALRVRPRAILAPVGVGVALVLLFLVLPGDAGALFRFKVFNLLNIESQTAVLRLVTYTLGFQQSLQHPVLGWGTFTFAPLVAEGNDFQQFENWRSLWIGNYFLLALHDTGVIGLFLWCGLIWSTVAGAVRATRQLSGFDPVIAVRTLGLTAAVVSLLVAFLATSGFSLGYPWLLIGLLAAHCRLAREAREVPATQPHPTTAADPDAAI